MGGPEVPTPVESSIELLCLHAVRLKGLAESDEVADRFALDPYAVRELLLDFQAAGWVSRVDFAGTGGWTLTATGQGRGERQLAEELAATGSVDAVTAAYGAFRPLNDRLLRAATDWQLRPSPDDPLAENDHTDRRWDRRVVESLVSLSRQLRGVVGPLESRLRRFTGYDARFAAALERVQRGDHAWVNRPRVDSCHTVWMELHEDLLATLGVRRGAEPTGP